jgi:hypothetical protein
LSFTVELTRGSEREVVETTRYFDVPLGRVIAATKVLVDRPPRSEGAPAPDGFLVLDEFGRPVAVMQTPGAEIAFCARSEPIGPLAAMLGCNPFLPLALREYG